jgi:hypothetical protein
MFLTVVSGLQNWVLQLQRLLVHRFDHLSPQEYCIMLVFVIAIGYTLLQGRR